MNEAGRAHEQRPGGEARPGTAGTGKVDGQRCEECAGTGKVTEGIGGG